MAKRPNKKLPVPAGPWKTEWPATDDLNVWLRMMFEKAQAIDDSDRRRFQSTLAFELLAERGLAEEALALSERLLATIPAETDALGLVNVLESAAEICLEQLDDVGRAEGYIDRVLALEPLYKRPSDRGFVQKNVEQFRILQGLMDPALVSDPVKRQDAAFSAAHRRVRIAMKRGESPAAREALQDAEVYALHGEEWAQRFRSERVINSYIALGDAIAARRLINGLPQAIRRDVLLNIDLVSIGARDEAIALNEDELREAMERLAGGGDPNVHFVALGIQRALQRLVKLREFARAREWLALVLEQGRSWALSGFGFASAGLFRILAKVTADLESPAAAAGLLGLAETEGQSESRSNWRSGASAELLELHMEIGNTEEALRLAKKMRSPAAKRKALTKMLAKARRWPELIEVLREVQTPLEACELCWVVRFAIDPAWKN